MNPSRGARRFLPWGVVLAVLVLHLPYLSPGGPALRPEGLDLLFEHDEATVVYDAYRIALGAVPYRDFFNFKGPVFGVLHGLAFRLRPDWSSAQLLFLIADAASAGLLAALVQRFSGSAAAMAAAGIHAGLLVPVWPRPYEQWWAGLFVLLTLVAMTGRQGRTRLSSGLAGVCSALAALTVQSIGVPFFLATVTFAALRDRLDGRWVALGGGSVLTVAGVSGAYLGALGPAYHQMWIWPRHAYAAFQLWPYGHGARAIHARLGELDLMTWSLGGGGLLLLVLLPWLQAAAVGIEGLRSVARARPLSDRRLVCGLAGAASIHLLWPGMNRDVTHLAFVGDFALLSVAVVFARARPSSPRLRIGGAIGLLVVALLPFLSLTVRAAFGPARDGPSWREAARRQTVFLEALDALPRHARIVYGGAAPGYSYFYVRAAATPLTNIPDVPQAWPGYYDEAQIRWLVDGIHAPETAALVLTRAQHRFLRGVDPDIERAFSEVGAHGRFVLMMRRETTRDGRN